MSSFDASQFIRELRPVVQQRLQDFDVVDILYHGDVDGACAAACMAKFAQQHGLGVSSTRRILTAEFDFSTLPSFLSSTEGAVVTVDINFSSKSGFLQYLDATFGDRLIIIDDHVLNFDSVQISRTLLANPNISTIAPPIDFASSLACFLLMESNSSPQLDWIASLGLHFDRQLHKYRHLFKHVPPDHQMFEVIRLLSATYFFSVEEDEPDFGLTLLLQALEQNSDWPEFRSSVRNSTALQSKQRLAQREIDELTGLLMAESQSFSTKAGTLFFFWFSSSTHITNIISSNMRRVLPGGLYLAMREDGDRALFELRAADSVPSIDFVECLSSVSRFVNLLNFGGHPRAAGGAVSKAFAERFLKALLKVLGGNYEGSAILRSSQ